MRKHDVLVARYLEELKMSIHMLKENLDLELKFGDLTEEDKLKSTAEYISETGDVKFLIREFWKDCNNLNARNYDLGIREFERPYDLLVKNLSDNETELKQIIDLVRKNSKL